MRFTSEQLTLNPIVVMLQILRDKAQSLVIQAIVVVIALVFIFWGVGTNMMNKQEAAIVVNDEEISFQQFQQAYDQAYSRIAQQFGGTIPKGLAEGLNIRQQVISQLTQQALLRQGGREMGLMVSGHEIQKEIETMVQFQENGQFSIERYKTILASNRLSPTKFEQSMRFDLLSQKSIDSLSSFAQPPTDFEIEELYNLEKETVSVSYVVFSPETFLEEVEVNDQDLAAWYQDAGDRYLTEPQVQLTYLPFSFNDIADRITIEAAAVQDYYDQHLPQYQIPEKRKARHILFTATPEDSTDVHEAKQSKAEEILKRAQDGEDFSSLARQYSEGPSGPNGGDLGLFSRGQMIQPFEDAVFALQTNEISGVVKTDFGYHIILLEEIQDAKVRSLEEVREEIVTALKMEQARPLAFQVVNDAYENIIGAGSLAAYLSANPDAKIVETDFFSRTDPPEGMSADPRFLERAFQLKENELSSIVETDAGYAIISASAIKVPEVPELSTIIEKVREDYKTAKAEEAAREAAETFLSDINKENVSFEERALTAGQEVKLSGLLTKSGASQETSFPQALIQSVFRLSA
ncbi:MAG: SurA N-terminal domain-containing protein, partial [Desulfocapsaceae bacterium]|nr:SurA N-terminal domain-containing protein [Desulfocapsaceae bacterium]